MAEIKTKKTNESVEDFINTFADTEQKRNDSFQLLKLMQDITGHEPRMWGASIIGFGSYHYKSERSRQEGDWPLVGFSPRKAAISLYIYSDTEVNKLLVRDLGKIKMGKGCIYVKKISDIDQDILRKMIEETIRFLHEKYK
jgi:hypothetical protein